MKWSTLCTVLLGLAGSLADGSAECREKQSDCYKRVGVNASSFIGGLLDEVPKEVYEAFVEASAECLQCVGASDVKRLDAGDDACGRRKCRQCGKRRETEKTCHECCGECRCMGCEYNYGPGKDNERLCDPCCPGSRRFLSFEPANDYDDDGAINPVGASVDFSINVCMDDISPLDPSSTYYTDYVDMLEDFATELKACYEDSEAFYNSWASICADSGIDLSLLARKEGDPSTILFSMEYIDTKSAKVTTYSSDESHRSTSHMIFYSALGFVVVSAFAVLGTAVVVKVLNNRKEHEKEQTAKWVSEMVNVDASNPIK